MELDWGTGSYEETGVQLLPVSEVVVELAKPLAGRKVLDVGCGTGNAALLAAAEGAEVTAVDPAARLLEVAGERAAQRGLQVEFLSGDAGGLPVGDGTADVVLSVFAVIFAPEPEKAIAELARVTAEDGRIILTAWPPGGPLTEIAVTAGKFMAQVFGQPDGDQATFGWHDPDALRAAFAPHGFEVEVERRELVVNHRSPEAFVEQSSSHPMAVAGANALAQRPDGAELAQELEARLLAVARAANEDANAFRVTNPYAVVTARRA
ncbi:ubiquinone/menaquinone biosynthesis C-methylase UbiE [Kribbella sp. VKM Ac-2527]|uniref:Ubiquinone/menaquinone biosynthesis C-methylase UbiE n=1 Tax=Kribbella caucasensis TaxID=2512215 RepID=A0A4R6KNW0_9ACTN|nr:methyltransferase domain-containing protein [Kribbella sp. VKM Ac-2527]TDO52706.1 ubiquinone/menaquinone biosynthesis C-methylase UbiE [Kribbella sp. VKM Ac-2527]